MRADRGRRWRRQDRRAASASGAGPAAARRPRRHSQARNLALDLGERFGHFRFLIRDQGSNFTGSFDAVFQATGTTILRTAVQAPRMNAICERLIGTLCLELSSSRLR